jgi:catechol 2,3-dioxygenase-like lactoylglutathione lyase family enzyme
LCFQHIALVTEDMKAAFACATQAGAKPISSDGPQALPVSSGGVTAWKFRDLDGHPLEFLQFPAGHPPGIGYDHSAISVADATRSIEFYSAIGLSLKQRQVNRGIAQDRLDALSGAVAEVIAMASPSGPPHLELLAYRSPKPPPGAPPQPNDIVADRLVFTGTAGGLSLAHDPDGHILLRDGRSRDSSRS